MGGCRCTYRNCTVKSDGVTHMFHYPVFDKVRCHEWLTNAERLEFLNLKVSQLKNRVVCQHHFKTQYFMNYMKDKLTFDAVPTLDGPFCDLSKITTRKEKPVIAKVFPITRDDIENTEYLSTSEKRANFSVKYGNFLTNCDVMDIDNLNQSYNAGQTKTTSKSNGDNIVPTNFDFDYNHSKLLFEDHPPSNVINSNMSKQPAPIVTYTKPVVVGIDVEELSLLSGGQKQAQVEKTPTVMIKGKPRQEENKSIPKSKKINIISEKKISEPIKVVGKLTPVSPSIIIEPLDKSNIDVNEPNTNIINIDLSQDTQIQKLMSENKPRQLKLNQFENDLAATVVRDVIQLEIEGNEQPKVEQDDSTVKNMIQTSTPKGQKQFRDVKSNGSSPKISLIKPKITPERVAAIEEKRKFNMKLRDIIESCLENFNENGNNNTKVTREQRSKQSKEHVGDFLSEDPKLPSKQEYTLASIEARMKRMEDILLNRIDQNSQKILELRESLPLSSEKGNVRNKRKTSCTQTIVNEEIHKKQLYQEISKYLTPETNSLIYEELFINKFVQKMPTGGPSPKIQKKRKKRSFINLL